MHELSTLSIEYLGQFPTSVNIKSPISLASGTISALWSKFKIHKRVLFSFQNSPATCLVSIANKLVFLRDWCLQWWKSAFFVLKKLATLQAWQIRFFTQFGHQNFVFRNFKKGFKQFNLTFACPHQGPKAYWYIWDRR